MTEAGFMHAAMRSRNFVMGLTLTAVFALAALISLFWTPYDVTQLDIASKLQKPSAEHLFGTDHFGRDILSMIMVGARTSIAVALRRCWHVAWSVWVCRWGFGLPLRNVAV